MKRIFILSCLVILNYSVYSTVQIPSVIGGSWINENVYNYYTTNKTDSCLEHFFEKMEYVPLYISFLNSDSIKLTVRFEQKVKIFSIQKVTEDSLIGIFDQLTVSIKIVEKNFLSLRYGSRIITFRKVSNQYSQNVFSEFIKYMVFKDHILYVIKTFKILKKYPNEEFNKNNFELLLKNIFQCHDSQIIELGVSRISDKCTPVLALYYDDSRKNVIYLSISWDENGSIDFINNKSGEIYLSIAPKDSK